MTGAGWALAVGLAASAVTTIGGLIAIRRQIRAEGAERTRLAVEDRLWREDLSRRVDGQGQVLERVAAWFAPVEPGRTDVSLPARVARVEQAVEVVTSQIDALDRTTREHMQVEQERWSGEAQQRQADSRELRQLLSDGLARVHERTDEQAKQATAIRAELAEHIDGPATQRDRRIAALEAALTARET